LDKSEYIRKALLETKIILDNLSRDTKKIEDIASLWADCLRSGNKIMFCGNGGSAGDSQHMVGELVGRFNKNREPLAALSLSTDTTVLTAIANDYSFEETYSRQIRALGQNGDVLVAISTSGSSQNVLRAIEAARNLKIGSICITGFPGEGKTGADLELVIPSSKTPRIQEGYFAVGHILCGLVEQILFPS
jgi:D-sedoheptulose 7-phosphate isomerase